MRYLLPLLLLSTQAGAATIPTIPLTAAPAATPTGTTLNDLLPYPARATTGIRATLLPLIQAEATKAGVPVALADAVAMIETGYDPNAVGTSGEIGLMQVMPSTAISLGFNQPQEKLFDPATNIHFGVAYLSRTWAASGGNACRALMKYRAGLGEEAYTPLSIQYCQRAATWLTTQDSVLAANVTTHTPAMPDGADVPDPHVIHLASLRNFHFDPAAFTAITDIPVAADGAAAAPRATARHGRHLAESVLAAIQEDNAGDDPHVVHITSATAQTATEDSPQ